ncbi:MAG: FtsJ-like methyltransferase [Faunusvirus sp.]|jgi:23S rRNA U2552 (ribose-2'-O)-methylase RlmE/FtsJ|uniref:FtsJ-like methyltransferase n=1 Tax=Faunusvirus sp. TaxID=2487766 RepID=A0A3G4ZW59_9VIRU|nr:MAG: FtsJ-like methyltransferase [Faunusvirus sp.]
MTDETKPKPSKSDIYKPQVYQLPIASKSIFTTTADITDGAYIAQSLFTYGFQHYINFNKDKMSKLDKEKLKNKRLFHIVNPFEHTVPEYDKDIAHTAIKYFGLSDDTPGIISRAFYKMWEIIVCFDLIPHTMKDFVSAHLAEGPGGFIQATMFYRDKFSDSKYTKNDRYCTVTLHNDDKKTKSGIKYDDKFVECYSKQTPAKFVQHATVATDASESDNGKDDGDLTNIKTIKLFRNQIQELNKEYAYLVTADGGFTWRNENYQEQEAYRLILGEILTAISVQRKGGVFICKIFGMFTPVTAKYMCILQEFYDNVVLYKPYTSRPSNSELYIVAISFKYEHDKKLEDKIKIMEELLDGMNKAETNGRYILDIFPKFVLSDDYKRVVKMINITLSNIQFIAINKIITYKDSGNYYGDSYHIYRDEQIRANNFWINTFLPLTAADDKAMKAKIQKTILDTIAENKTLVK